MKDSVGADTVTAQGAGGELEQSEAVPVELQLPLGTPVASAEDSVKERGEDGT